MNRLTRNCWRSLSPLQRRNYITILHITSVLENIIWNSIVKRKVFKWPKSEGKGSTSSAPQNLSQMHYSGSILDSIFIRKLLQVCIITFITEWCQLQNSNCSQGSQWSQLLLWKGQVDCLYIWWTALLWAASVAIHANWDQTKATKNNGKVSFNKSIRGRQVSTILNCFQRKLVS